MPAAALHHVAQNFHPVVCVPWHIEPLVRVVAVRAARLNWAEFVAHQKGIGFALRHRGWEALLHGEAWVARRVYRLRVSDVQDRH
jgi:hypothetical protein